MKKLNTNSAGRMPLWQADIDWIQQAYTEPIEAIVKELGADTKYFVVTGCQVTHNVDQISMTGGWMWWDGELLPVRELKESTTVSPYVRLTRVAYTDDEGSRNFIAADHSATTVSDVWQDDYIQPELMTHYSPTDEGAGVYIREGAMTLLQRIKRQSADAESAWITPAQNVGSLQYKQIGRMVVLKGITLVRTDTTPAATGLPIPLGEKAVLHLSQLTTGLEIYVNIDGELICHVASGQSSAEMFDLTGIMYMAASPITAAVVDGRIFVNET